MAKHRMNHIYLNVRAPAIIYTGITYLYMNRRITNAAWCFAQRMTVMATYKLGSVLVFGPRIDKLNRQLLIKVRLNVSCISCPLFTVILISTYDVFSLTINTLDEKVATDKVRVVRVHYTQVVRLTALWHSLFFFYSVSTRLSSSILVQ